MKESLNAPPIVNATSDIHCKASRRRGRWEREQKLLLMDMSLCPSTLCYILDVPNLLCSARLSEEGISIPILQTEKLRLREVKYKLVLS